MPKPTKGKYGYSKQSPKKQGTSTKEFMAAERAKTEAQQGSGGRNKPNTWRASLQGAQSGGKSRINNQGTDTGTGGRSNANTAAAAKAGAKTTFKQGTGGRDNANTGRASQGGATQGSQGTGGRNKPNTWRSSLQGSKSGGNSRRGTPTGGRDQGNTQRASIGGASKTVVGSGGRSLPNTGTASKAGTVRKPSVDATGSDWDQFRRRLINQGAIKPKPGIPADPTGSDWDQFRRRLINQGAIPEKEIPEDPTGTDWDQFRRRLINQGAITDDGAGGSGERPEEEDYTTGGASISELQRQLEQRQMMQEAADAISLKLNSMLGPVAPPATPYGGKGFGGTAPAGGGDPGGMNMSEEQLLEEAMAEGVIDPAEVTQNNKSEWLDWLLMVLNPQMGFLNLGWKAMGGWEGITNPEYPFSPEYKALQEQREADRQAADDREAIRNRGLNYGAQVNQLPTDEAGQPVELTPEQELEQLLGGITDDAFLKYFNGAFGHLGTEDQLRILKGLLEARGETPAAANIEDLLSNTPDRPAIQPLRKYGTSASDWRPDRRGQSNISGT